MMSWTEVMVAVTVRREWGGEILKDLGPMGLVVICEVREREGGKKISRMISQFLPWIGEWVVGYTSGIENIDRRAGLREGGEHELSISYCE